MSVDIAARTIGMQLNRPTLFRTLREELFIAICSH